jgi:hypothetical protein
MRKTHGPSVPTECPRCGALCQSARGARVHCAQTAPNGWFCAFCPHNHPPGHGTAGYNCERAGSAAGQGT